MNKYAWYGVAFAVAVFGGYAVVAFSSQQNLTAQAWMIKGLLAVAQGVVLAWVLQRLKA